MSNRSLSKSDRITVANAIQLIRDAGYDKKADLLDHMLQDNDIDIDQNMKRGTFAYASYAYFFGTNTLLYEQISINFTLFSPNWLDYPLGSKTPKQKPYTRKDPELFVLATTLHHEADHVLGDDELASFGGEITFCKKVCKDMNYYFPKLSAAEKTKMKAKIKEMQDCAEAQRKDIAARGGESYGEGYRKTLKKNISHVHNTETCSAEIVRNPSEPSSPERVFLDEVGEKILHFEEKFGRLPEKLEELLDVMDQLDVDCNSRRPHAASPKKQKGQMQIVDGFGNPLVYRVPGRIFEERFDLYSLGECGKDLNGEVPNVLYLMNRR